MDEENKELSKRERKKLNKEKDTSKVANSGMQNKLVAVGAIVALAVGAFWFMYRGGNEEQSTDTPEAVAPSEVSAQDHVKGPEEAVVTLVEYGDFQCPACAAYYPITQQLADEFKEDLRVVYRHFPLSSIHRHAQIAAQAAEAAADQGAFWEMHDILFERQEDWSNVRDPRSLFVEYADEITLNTEQFEEYMNSVAAKDRVQADYDAGFAAGISSTPTFYINGDKVSVAPQGLEPFRQLIQTAVDSAKAGGDSTMEEGSDSAETEEASPSEDIAPSL